MDVPLAVGIGLVASLIQSLGLTMQRRSHVQNQRLPETERQSVWRRPMWIAGFVVFLSANISGTLFQIGTLPVVILAPLGAVSLLYNALLARVMLDAIFSWHMLTGTCLIALGAIMVGYFGAVPHAPLTLAELMELYKRPPFVAIALVYTLVLATILAIAHFTEYQLTWQPLLTLRRRRRTRFGWRRYLPVPSLATVAEVSENSSGVATPTHKHLDSEERLLPDHSQHAKRMHGTLPQNPHIPDYGAVPSQSSLFDMPNARSTVLALAVAYSSASGLLSGACLVMAKSGVDLLILSLQGRNQFSSGFSWCLILVLFAAAMLQLWYLHKGLQLADPMLIAPLAFCFYNVSSITLGLVYFNDAAYLSWLSVAMIVVGTVLLLAGVWALSLHRQSDTLTSLQPDPIEANEPSSHVPGHALSSRRMPSALSGPKANRPPSSISLDYSLQRGIEQTDAAPTQHRTSWLTMLAERGLSVGLSASSPGFHVQSQHQRHSM